MMKFQATEDTSSIKNLTAQNDHSGLLSQTGCFSEEVLVNVSE